MTSMTSTSCARVRVAIVGAGVAGLAAANALVRTRKVRVDELCVLEAQGRVGGRVQTRAFSDSLPVNVEVGAAWIHGTHGNAFAALAREHKIALKEISARNPWLHPESCDRFVLMDGASLLRDEEVQATWGMYALLLQQLQQLATTADESARELARKQSLAQVIDGLVEQEGSPLRAAVDQLANGRAGVGLCVRLIEIWMGATADALQLDDFVEIDLIGDDPGPHCIVPDGMERFIDALAEPVRASIQTDVCVTSIAYSDENDAQVTAGATLECSDGRTIHADYVIVTAALGLLKARKLAFSPALPVSKQVAIDRSSMGQYMKVLVQFPDVFWPRDAKFIGQLSRTTRTDEADGANDDDALFFPLMFNYYAAKNVPVLEGVLVGESAADVSRRLSDDVIVAAFVKQLKRSFGAAVSTPVGHFITRWDQDPWARGAYSCLTVESSDDDPETLRQSVANKVFFAGEAMIYKYQGALQAAYLSGLAAVDDLERHFVNDGR